MIKALLHFANPPVLPFCFSSFFLSFSSIRNKEMSILKSFQVYQSFEGAKMGETKDQNTKSSHPHFCGAMKVDFH
jgi:hypothetical protein